MQSVQKLCITGKPYRPLDISILRLRSQLGKTDFSQNSISKAAAVASAILCNHRHTHPKGITCSRPSGIWICVKSNIHIKVSCHVIRACSLKNHPANIYSKSFHTGYCLQAHLRNSIGFALKKKYGVRNHLHDFLPYTKPVVGDFQVIVENAKSDIAPFHAWRPDAFRKIFLWLIAKLTCKSKKFFRKKAVVNPRWIYEAVSKEIIRLQKPRCRHISQSRYLHGSRSVRKRCQSAF